VTFHLAETLDDVIDVALSDGKGAPSGRTRRGAKKPATKKTTKKPDATKKTTKKPDATKKTTKKPAK
jgi:hypothetical protein